jgi:hypothetical protein
LWLTFVVSVANRFRGLWSVKLAVFPVS